MIKARRQITLMSTAVLALTCWALTGCGGSGGSHPHTVVFSVTGDGYVGAITYVIDGRTTTERSVTLPWRRTVQVPPRDGGHTWDLKTHQGNGTSTTVVYVDGSAFGGSSCSGTNCDGGSSGSISD
jgi:hypothetical protein